LTFGLFVTSLNAQKPPEQFSIQIIHDADDPGLLSIALTLHWTAPGDDGVWGRAVAYDLRYVPSWLGPIDSEAEWNQAQRVAGEPPPSPAGQRDSMTVTGLVSGLSYYFCVKTVDEADNWSPLSNSPMIALNLPIKAFAVGDVNNSGDVNGLDLVYLIRALKGTANIPSPDLRGDVDGKCDVNGLDVLYLRSYLNGGSKLRRAACASDMAQLMKQHLRLSDKEN